MQYLLLVGAVCGRAYKIIYRRRTRRGPRGLPKSLKRLRGGAREGSENDLFVVRGRAGRGGGRRRTSPRARPGRSRGLFGGHFIGRAGRLGDGNNVARFRKRRLVITRARFRFLARAAHHTYTPRVCSYVYGRF